jgi:hypothetical protein
VWIVGSVFRRDGVAGDDRGERRWQDEAPAVLTAAPPAPVLFMARPVVRIGAA